METTDRQAQGRRDNRKGKAWQRACAQWLRDSGLWPAASYELRRGTGDIIGTDDLLVECTVSPWDRISDKFTQAARDQSARGARWFVVWKKPYAARGERGTTDPGRGVIVMPADQFWAMAAEARDLRAQLEQERAMIARMLEQVRG